MIDLLPMEIARQYTLELVSALLAIPLLLSTSLAARRLLVSRYRIPLGARFKIACAAISAHLPLFIYQWTVEAQFATHSATPKDVAVENATASQRAEAFLRTLNLWTK